MSEGLRQEVLRHLDAALAECGVELGDPAAALDLALDRDLGLDSFQFMQIARHLEQRYDFRFSVADWLLAEQDRDEPDLRVGGLIDFVVAELDRAPMVDDATHG